MSIRQTLLIRLLMPVGFLLIAGSVIAYVLTLHYVTSVYDSWLYDLARSVAQEVGEDGVLDVDVEDIEQQLRTWQSDDREYFSVTVGGAVIAGEPGLPEPSADSKLLGIDARVYDAARGGEFLRMIALDMPAQAGRPAVRIKVGQEKFERRKLAKEMLLTTLAPGIAMILLALLLIRGAVRSSLAGLDTVTARLLAHPEAQTLQLQSERIPEELRSLTAAFVGLVERNNALLRAQQGFIANAAHQLRSPITATELHLDGVEHAESAEQRQTSLGQLRRSVARTHRLATQLLSLARLEPGTRPTIAMNVFDAVEMLRTVGADHVPLALNKRIEIELDVPDQPLPLRGNELLLREAMSNLLDNAVRYHPGGGNIRLKARADDRLIQIEVADDGPGVTDEFAQRLFARFARGDEGSTDTGAGLGLAIVREIVDLHGGEVRAERGLAHLGLRIIMTIPAPESNSATGEGNTSLMAEVRPQAV